MADFNEDVARFLACVQPYFPILYFKKEVRPVEKDVVISHLVNNVGVNFLQVGKTTGEDRSPPETHTLSCKLCLLQHEIVEVKAHAFRPAEVWPTQTLAVLGKESVAVHYRIECDSRLTCGPHHVLEDSRAHRIDPIRDQDDELFPRYSAELPLGHPDHGVVQGCFTSRPDAI